MIISTNLLKRFINVSDDSENFLTTIDQKISKVVSHNIHKVPQEITIGFVKAVEKHPNADRLQICQINCGEKGDFQIITGGENIKENIYVAVALPGSYLPSIDLKIEPRKMRGIESFGMICSKKELGIKEDEDKHWIWILDEDLDVNPDYIGKPFCEVYNWIENIQIEIENENISHFEFATKLYASYCNNIEKIKFTSLPKQYDTFLHTQMLEALNFSKKSEYCLDTEHTNSIAIELNNISIQRSSFFLRVLMLHSQIKESYNWYDFSKILEKLYGIKIQLIDRDKLNDKTLKINEDTQVGESTKNIIMMINHENYNYCIYSLLFILDDLKFFGNDLGNYEIAGTCFQNIDFASKKSLEINISELPKSEQESQKILAYLGYSSKLENDKLLISLPIWTQNSDINGILNNF